MTFKRNYLKKTNIFFPNALDMIRAKTMSADLLDDIIDHEETAFAQRDSRGAQWPLGSVISVARKHGLLTPAAHRRLLFHIMRRSALPKVGKQDIDIVLLAYEDVMSELHLGYPMVHFPQIEGIFYFGYHGVFNLDRGAPFSHDELTGRCVTIAQCQKYVHAPGMLAKIDKFLPFAGDAMAWRILGTLRVAHYEPLFDPYSVHLDFWGMLTILLLNASTRFEVFRDLARLNATRPVTGEKRALLKRYVEAIADPDLSREFAAMAW